MISSLLLSIIIELLQGAEGYFQIAEGTMPIMDITDVMLNAAGGVLGFLAYRFYTKQVI